MEPNESSRLPAEHAQQSDINDSPLLNNDAAAAANEQPSSSSSTSGNADPAEGTFECNICFDPASDAVVTYCGHLFCWPCLNAWIDQQPAGEQACPVCKGRVNKERVIPLYGRHSKDNVDPREKARAPQRPQGQWQESRQAPDTSFYDFGGVAGPPGGFHMTFGVGAFPFGVFATAFNFDLGGANGPNHRQIDPGVFRHIFLFLGIFLITWLVLG